MNSLWSLEMNSMYFKAARDFIKTDMAHKIMDCGGDKAMNDFTLKEYTQEEYKADMLKLLKEKGLHDAVEVYTDMIAEEIDGTNYVMRSTVYEFLCDILYLIDLESEKLVDELVDESDESVDECRLLCQWNVNYRCTRNPYERNCHKRVEEKVGEHD